MYIICTHLLSLWLTRYPGFWTYVRCCHSLVLPSAQLSDTFFINQQLVGGFKHVLFSIIYGITLPID